MKTRNLKDRMTPIMVRNQDGIEKPFWVWHGGDVVETTFNEFAPGVSFDAVYNALLDCGFDMEGFAYTTSFVMDGRAVYRYQRVSR